MAHSVIIGLHPGRREFSKLNKAFEMKHSGTKRYNRCMRINEVY